MGVLKVATIYCNKTGCNNRWHINISGVMPTRQSAKDHGWTYVAPRPGNNLALDFCPDHAIDPDDLGAC